MAVETHGTSVVLRRIRGLAAEQRLPQGALADRIGISRMAMSRRMNGRTPFTPDELTGISRELGTTVGSLFDELPTAPVSPLPAGVAAAVASTPLVEAGVPSPGDASPAGPGSVWGDAPGPVRTVPDRKVRISPASRGSAA